ncbi:MAG: tRNA (5-methylaminomethyl-2-thiouridine)(34)-methyltransferase MnmD [Oceanicaulis sp.]
MSAPTLKRPHPELDWSGPGPVAREAGDVYFSNDDGLEESRSVFLAGAGFPARFNETPTVVGELGFGTGLNFLALWDLFRRTARPGARLHFVSVEGFPLRREDAARALSAFPEIAPLADALIAAWPSPHLGPHRRVFEHGRVTLTVFHDTVAAALAQMDFAADAWFLDGFAPAKNPAMWSPALFAEIARLSRPGAPAATFTVAGAVRRGLAEAGFAVEKKPGFGRKRERLEAVYQGAAAPPRVTPFPRPRSVSGPVAVIGGGVAAASLVEAFARRGVVPDVFAEGGWAAGASGAPLGLLTPRLEAADRPHNRALLAAFDFARTLYDGRPGFTGGGVLRLSEDRPERLARLAEALDDRFSWTDHDDAETGAGPGLFMQAAGRFEPARLIADLAGQVQPLDARVFALDPAGDEIVLRGAEGRALGAYAAVLLAGGWQGAALANDLPIEATAGRVGVFEAAGAPRIPVAWGGYAAPLRPGRALIGATHRRRADPGAPDAAEAALRKLAAALPGLKLGVMVDGWGGVRAAAPDRLPIAGPLPGDRFSEDWADHARGGPAPEDAEGPSRVLALSAFGARGFAHAPLLAEDVVSALFGEPAALERSGAEALHPARFAFRALRRG